MNLEIPINSQSVLFKQHLDDPRNERIIFSGIFGIGKSYFLEKYFEAEKENYVAINLRPINYSISSNEDIFRVIKYDILYELIFTHDLKLVIESVSKSIAYGVALGDKLPSILESFLPFIPLLNKDVPDFAPLLSLINKVVPNINEVEKIRKDVNLNSRLDEFVKEVGGNFLFESDFITAYIEKSLDSLSNKDDKESKSKVLIIDDLDRIDPEHTFRLFNIFSAHLDYHKSSANKFGFDKVIFVCDIDNIRNIFTTRYGANVDFTGYIDKFYSTEIYYFNNDKEIATATDRILESIDFGNYKEFLKEQLFKQNGKGLLYFLINACIKSGSLRIRRIKSVYGYKYKFRETQLSFIHKNSIYNYHLPSIIALEILVWIFGSVETVDKALQKLIQFGKSYELSLIHNIERFAGYFIPVIDYQNHKFNVNNFSNSSIPQYELTIQEKTIAYRLQEVGSRRDQYWCDIISISGGTDDNSSSYIFEIIYKSFQILKDKNYIK